MQKTFSLPDNFKIADIVKRDILDNGLEIFAVEKHDAPLVTVQAWVKTGSIHEGNFLGCGLSHFLEHMMFQGTKKYPGNKIAEIVHECGGDINAYTSFGNTTYYIDLPSQSFETAADILADVIRNPLFPEGKFATEKDVILRERDMYLDRPNSVISEKLWNNMFRVHPVRHPIIGYREKIEKVDRDIMAEYYARRYAPARSFFVVSGNIEADKVFSFLRSKLEDWEPGQLEEPMLPIEPKQLCRKNLTYYFEDPLARLSIGCKIPESTHPDIPALDILSAILGNSKSSRLPKVIKNEKELATNISAFNYTPYFCGIFGIGALCSPEKTEKMKDSILEEVKKIKTEKVRKDETEREVLQQGMDYIRTLKTNSGIARILGNTVMGYGSTDYVDKYLEDISSVTSKKIMEVAEKYLAEENMTIVEMLPEEQKETQKAKKKNGRQKAAKPEIEKLPAGQKIVSFADGKLPLVDICAAFPGGVIMEDASNAGISRLIASMLTTGTKKMSEDKISEILDNNAIDFSVSSGNNTLVFRINCHRDKAQTALDILESILKEPTFPEKEFSREKNNAIDSLKSRNLTPQNMAEDRMCELLYGSHPYSHPSVGFIESVSSLTVKDLKDFYSKCLSSEKAVFGVAGDIEGNEIQERLKNIFNGIKWSDSKISLPDEPVFPDKSVFEKVETPRQQSVVMHGMPGCSVLDKDSFIIDLFYPALNGQSSRIFKSIREDEGLAYYTGLFTSRGIHEGFLAFYAGTHPETAEAALKKLEKERKKLVKKGFLLKEFNDAKACLKNSTAEQFEKLDSLIFNSILSEFYGNGFELPWKRLGIYEKITLEDANEILKKYMGGSSFISIIAGP
jgi:zinc protease